MYLPDAFREDDPRALAALIGAHPFATLVTTAGGAPLATHIPVLHEPEPAPLGRLVGHVARANPHAEAIAGGAEALVIFQGPHGYVSPSWYVAEGPAVPTWNYVAVHAYGRLQPSDDPAATRALLERLVATFEAGPSPPWWTALPERYLAGMIVGIRAFALPIARLEGKIKLSQNRPLPDRRAVIAALRRAGDAASLALADAMAAASA
ncbi:MAG: FMN-binding negative transcriptional regulator [Alphaproteobacteria bacterium]|nr:FMN-binding negative transcriptional regulator [Alphaproteobacteria bacterium]